MRLVYVALTGPESHMYLRPLDQFESTVIPGTEGAYEPFFSPDGQWVGFTAEGQLKKVSLNGGLPITLTDGVSDFFRSFIVTHVADFLGEHLRSVLDLAQYYNELSAGIKAHLISDFEKYGVTVIRLMK